MVWNGSHFSRAPECGVPDKCEEFLQRYLFFLNYDVSKPITVQCDESQSCLRAAIAARCLACLLCFSSPRWHRILLCTNQEKRCLPSLGHVTSPTNTSTGKTFCGIHAHKTVGYEKHIPVELLKWDVSVNKLLQMLISRNLLCYQARVASVPPLKKWSIVSM